MKPIELQRRVDPTEQRVLALLANKDERISAQVLNGPGHSMLAALVAGWVGHLASGYGVDAQDALVPDDMLIEAVVKLADGQAL